MRCKNCQHELREGAHYCDNCGAKVIRERITFKSMISGLLSKAFGWDNKYILTLRSLILKPDVVFKEYIGGTRNKYVNPFSFFAIGMAIALLTYNQFSEQYVSMLKNMNKLQMEMIDSVLPIDLQAEIDNPQKAEKLKKLSELQEKLKVINEHMYTGVLKYFNIFSFLMIPLYAYMAKTVFKKPYNYGEHIVIATFIQGGLFISGIIIFLIAVFIYPSAFYIGFPITLVAYLYGYSKLYGFTFKQVLLKLLRFLLIAIGLMIASLLLGMAVGYFFGRM